MRTATAYVTKFYVTCPQCGHLIDGWGARFEWDDEFLAEQNGKAECCGETFRVSRRIILKEHK